MKVFLHPTAWSEKQHYKNRIPPWIKLHRELLDNYDFMCLPVASKALAPMLWLLASESKTGKIEYASNKLAFRLRMNEEEFIKALSPLLESDFFTMLDDEGNDASDMLATCYPRDRDRERERDKERDKTFTELQPAKAVRPKTENDDAKKVRQEVWQAYADAYFNRYGTEPVRNAKVNGQVAQFCKRIPAEEAPHVAAFYLTHPNRWYVQKGHEFGQLLNEAEKLRTEWATNRKVTARESNEEDRLGGMAQAVAEIKAEMGWGQA